MGISILGGMLFNFSLPLCVFTIFEWSFEICSLLGWVLSKVSDGECAEWIRKAVRS